MRIRITFTKNGALRYIGHLDLHKLWERSTRRANLALMYSQGFHPQPKIQLAAALPLGFSSRCELVDMWVDGEVELDSLAMRLTKAVPPGLMILKVEGIEEKSPPLQTQVISAEYEVTLFEARAGTGAYPARAGTGAYPELDLPKLEERIRSTLESVSLPRERRGKAYDLRPLIEGLHIMKPDDQGHTRLWMQLAAREGATGRPEELLDALNLRYEDTRVERCKFLFR
jgi:radical SAM-linked protein